MIYKGSYKGLNNYNKVKFNKKNKKIIIFLLVFFITVMSVITVKISGLFNNLSNKMILSKEEIQSYIDLADKYTTNGYQLNWQEVAAVNYVINDDSFSIKDDTLEMAANSFIKKDKDGNVVGLNNFKSAMKSLGLKSSDEKEATEKLNILKNNYIHTELANDTEKKDFIKSIEDIAYDNYKKYGILPSITISQAILESGWGESTLSSKYNNLFGIKADGRWSGDSVDLETMENYEDVIVGAFRAYDSFKESIKDHGKFLYENERYAENGLFNGQTYKEQAQALENAGYSTAKDEVGNLIYGDKLVKVIQENNLMVFDTEAKRNN
ncbi:mannosyl-glycoprotein endo-beta-N-acetylglucosamidase [Clostridium tertium]|uniref:Exo-glucosaminidase LytG n=1 Tax=Clostridium tertium TaxID=1559 RepID=A0A6N3F4T5_9CLOT